MAGGRPIRTGPRLTGRSPLGHFTVSLMPNGPLAAVAEKLGPTPLAFAQFQMDATGALNVLRLTLSDGQTYELRRE